MRVEVDKRDMGSGSKGWEWIKKGAPVRIEIGPRDLAEGKVALMRRTKGAKEKEFVESAWVESYIDEVLADVQDTLLARATAFRDENTKKIDTLEEFEAFFTPKNAKKPEIHGGFALCHWAGSNEDEERIAKEHKVTIRCIPDGDEYAEEGTCFLTGKPSSRRVVFAKSY